MLWDILAKSLFNVPCTRVLHSSLDPVEHLSHRGSVSSKKILDPRCYKDSHTGIIDIQYGVPDSNASQEALASYQYL